MIDPKRVKQRACPLESRYVGPSHSIIITLPKTIATPRSKINDAIEVGIYRKALHVVQMRIVHGDR